jgi:hypothetical protein
MLDAKRPAGAGSGGDDARLEISLKAFGLIPRSMDLSGYASKLMLGQLVGFYVPRRKELALVTGPESLFGAAFVQRQGTERAGSMQQGTLVHELTHAVQDQHFDLAKLTADDPLSDADAARKALVEGDATLIMMADAGGIRPQDLPVIAVAFRTMLEDPTQFLALAPGVPGAADLAVCAATICASPASPRGAKWWAASVSFCAAPS